MRFTLLCNRPAVSPSTTSMSRASAFCITVEDDRTRVGALSTTNQFGTCTAVGPGFELLCSRGAKCVAGSHEDTLAIDRSTCRPTFADGGRLANSVHTYKKPHRLTFRGHGQRLLSASRSAFRSALSASDQRQPDRRSTQSAARSLRASKSNRPSLPTPTSALTRASSSSSQVEASIDDLDSTDPM